MSDVTDLIPYADRDPFPVKLGDGVRMRKTDDGYVVERLKPDLSWEALGTIGEAQWGNITGTLTDQSNVDTDDTLAADSDAKLATQKAVKAYVDAQAGGGGSFLSANTARVDSSGNDGTGEVGDLSKPFLTFTAAVNAVVANQIDGSLYGGIVDIGANNFNEADIEIAIDASTQLDITIVGAPGSQYEANKDFGWDITVAEGGSGPSIRLVNCVTGYFETNGGITITLENADLDNVEATGTNPVQIVSPTNSGGGSMFEIIAPTVDSVTLSGLIPYSGGSQVTTPNVVNIINCKARPDEAEYDSVFSIYDASEEIHNLVVNACNSLIGDITCVDATFVDSRALGSITVDNGIVYEDVLLKDTTHNVAYVDPSGNDNTGAIGMRGLPFLTVQGAVDAIEALDPIPDFPVIDIGTGDYSEDITTTLESLTFIGRSNWLASIVSELDAPGPLNNPFASLRFTTITVPIRLIIKDCFAPTTSVIRASELGEDSGYLFVQLINSVVYTVTNECDDRLIVDGSNTSAIIGPSNAIEAHGRLYISNFRVPVSAATDDTVNVTNSIINDLTSGDTTTFVDSRIIGTFTGDTIEYEDILLKGVPPGGTTGQIIKKTDNDENSFATAWDDLI